MEKDKREIRLIRFMMSKNGYVKAKEICNILDISSRTLRQYLKNSTDYFSDNGFHIHSIHAIGYKLIVDHEERYNEYIYALLKEEEKQQRLLPMYPEDRINYLIRLFLTTETPVKSDELADKLFISRGTLSNDMKEVRNRLSYFHLSLESKVGQGLILVGDMIHVRSCIAQYFYHTNTIDENYHTSTENKEQNEISILLLNVLEKHELMLTDIGFQNLVIHIMIAMKRNTNHFNIDFDYENLKSCKEYMVAQEIVNKIEEQFTLRLNSEEIYYITIHLLGKKMNTGNKIVTDEIDNLLTNIFHQIHTVYQYDFHSDFELYTLLALHFQPLLDRLKYGLTIQNPLLDSIKKDNPIAFEISLFAGKIISQEYGYKMDENEAGYLSLHFALAIDRIQKNQIIKNNIVVVCASGQGTSQILLYKLKKQFANQLGNIAVTQLYNLKNFPLENFDFVVSTVPIPFALPIPSIQVNYYLNIDDVNNISNVIKSEFDISFIKNYFSRELLFCNIDAKCKEDVFDYMISHFPTSLGLPNNYKQLVLEREKLSTTEIGNEVAIPHASCFTGDKTFVSIAILKKPIQWNRKKVKFVFLFNIKKGSNENLEILHEILANMVTNQEFMHNFATLPTIEHLTTLIQKMISAQDKEPVVF